MRTSGEATTRISGSRRVMSTRTSAAYRSEARTTRTSLAQHATASLSARPSRSDRSRPGT